MDREEKGKNNGSNGKKQPWNKLLLVLVVAVVTALIISDVLTYLFISRN